MNKSTSLASSGPLAKLSNISQNSRVSGLSNSMNLKNEILNCRKSSMLYSKYAPALELLRKQKFE
jgi:hypothetical protein